MAVLAAGRGGAGPGARCTVPTHPLGRLGCPQTTHARAAAWAGARSRRAARGAPCAGGSVGAGGRCCLWPVGSAPRRRDRRRGRDLGRVGGDAAPVRAGLPARARPGAGRSRPPDRRPRRARGGAGSAGHRLVAPGRAKRGDTARPGASPPGMGPGGGAAERGPAGVRPARARARSRNPLLYADAADLALRQGRLDEGRQYWEAARSRARSPDALLRVGEVGLRLGEPLAARMALREAARREWRRPLQAEVYRVWGAAALAAGLPEEAAQAYGEALRRDPGDVEARVQRAQALAEAGRREEASREARAALRLAPDNPQAAALLVRLSAP